MIADHRFQALSAVRVGVSTILTPVEYALMFPGKVVRNVGDYFISQDKLLADNKVLSEQVLLLSAEGQRARLITSEQTQIAAINAANERFSRDGVVAEIIRDARNPFARRIIINRGFSSGIKSGAAVIDGAGVVGQVTAVGASTAEVTLTTEKDQAVPVMIVRAALMSAFVPNPVLKLAAPSTAAMSATSGDVSSAVEPVAINRATSGLRAVAVGGGREGTIELPFIPVAADVQVGDELVTSGIDGTYPAGLSVAKVTIVDKNPAFSFARIVAQPSTAPDHHRFVKVLINTDVGYPQPDVTTNDRAAAAKGAPTKREAKLEAKRALRDR